MSASLASPANAPALLTLAQVAALLGYSARTVRRLVVAGAFPAPVRLTGPGAHPRWLATTVEEWMAAQAAGRTA